MVEIPIWLALLVGVFGVFAIAERALIPSVRWFIRRRAEKFVARLNTRLDRPIQPFKLAHRHDMIQRLIYDPEVSRAIAEHVEDTGTREDVVFEQARRYAREIVPSFSAFTYFKIGTTGAKWLSRALYRVRLGHYNETLGDIDSDATVIFVMNHRSNMDYVLVTYLSARQSALSYAVGEWARVWPLSRLIRNMGAYFIRRRSRSALYRAILARYVEMATAAGVAQAIFPEGGLSLDGGLAPPKLGLLDYVLRGARASEREVVFVPVALNYDRVLEDRVLVEAGRRGERRFRARFKTVIKFVFNQFWLRISGQYYRFGYAAVSFGAPLSSHDLGDRSTEELGVDLMDRIARVVPVLPVPLVSWAITKGAHTEAQVKEAVQAFVKEVPKAHVHLPRDSIDYAVEVGLRMLRMRHLVSEGPDFTVHDQALLEFYATSIVHLQHFAAGEIFVAT